MTWRQIVLLLALVVAEQARADDNWINHGGYESTTGEHCCGARDCNIVPAMDMQATMRGWLIKSLDEMVPYSEAQPSEDGEFWRCKRYDGSRRCFFAPPQGS